MAFSNQNLTAVGGHTGEGPGVFVYDTTDSESTVEGSSYFDSASNRLEQDAVLIVIYDTDGTPKVAMYRVSISSGSVTLNNLTNEAALTDNSGGTADDTIAAVSGSGADSTINNNFADLAAKVNALLTALGS